MTSSMSLPLIHIENLHKSFGSNHVLKGVTLDVFPGESLVIIGGSGSGKSVLLKCLLGLMPTDEGSIIQIAGKDMINASSKGKEEIRKKISMLFQGSALFDSLPVWENICFGLLQTKKLGRSEAYDLAKKTLPSVGLKAAVANLFPAELSGGMQRRVALARAVVSTPEIIFFDEPTTGLDPIMGSMIDHLIVKNVKELGATAITITHDMRSVRHIADRIAMIYQGKIIWVGSKNSLDQTDNPYVHQFINGLSEGPISLEV